MTVGRDQTIGDKKARTGNPCALGRLLVRESNVINSEYVADRIAITIQNQSRHRLLLLQFLNLLTELVYLLLKLSRTQWQKIMCQDCCGEREKENDDCLNEALPCATDRLFFHQYFVGVHT